MESLFKSYSEKFSERNEARISEATEKIGFASEMLGRPSDMLNLYYKDIEKYGNDPNNVGVDGILNSTEKYDEYNKLYGRSLDLLEKTEQVSRLLLHIETEKVLGNHFRNS